MMPEEKENEVPIEEEETLSKKDKKKVEKLEATIQELDEEIEKLKTEKDKWKNDYYRAFADTKNLRNSLEKEHKEALKYRAEGFIEDLLPILDSFYMALGNEPTDPNLKNYLTGFKFIYKNLVSVLENEGVKEILPTIGEEFNPLNMQAVDSIEDDEQVNKVTKIYGKGYSLHERLIRPAFVQVGVKKKEEKKDADENDA